MLGYIAAVTPGTHSFSSLNPQYNPPLRKIKIKAVGEGKGKGRGDGAALRRMGRRVWMLGRKVVKCSAVGQCSARCAVNSSVAMAA